MKPNLLKEAFKYGAICALILILLNYISWAMGMETFVKVSFWSKFVPYMIIIIILGGLQLRKKNNGFLSFNEALKFCFLCYVVVEVMFGISNYILYNLVDTQLAKKSFDIAMQQTRAMLEKMGQSSEKIDEAMKRDNSSSIDMGIGKIFLGTGLALIWDFVLALLISLIIRKEEKFSD